MFLLDTNIISELRKPKPHGAVVAWARAYPGKTFMIPAIRLYELQAGAEITRQQDQMKAREIENWIDRIVETYQVLSLDAKSARDTGRLMHGRSDHLIEDGMIAAIARMNGLIVATRNVKDFLSFDVKTVNPFLYEG